MRSQRFRSAIQLSTTVNGGRHLSDGAQVDEKPLAVGRDVQKVIDRRGPSEEPRGSAVVAFPNVEQVACSVINAGGRRVQQQGHIGGFERRDIDSTRGLVLFVQSIYKIVASIGQDVYPAREHLRLAVLNGRWGSPRGRYAVDALAPSELLREDDRPIATPSPGGVSRSRQFANGLQGFICRVNSLELAVREKRNVTTVG